jgi:hypothetical protein
MAPAVLRAATRADIDGIVAAAAAPPRNPRLEWMVDPAPDPDAVARRIVRSQVALAVHRDTAFVCDEPFAAVGWITVKSRVQDALTRRMGGQSRGGVVGLPPECQSRIRALNDGAYKNMPRVPWSMLMFAAGDLDSAVRFWTDTCAQQRVTPAVVVTPDDPRRQTFASAGLACVRQLPPSQYAIACEVWSLT